MPMKTHTKRWLSRGLLLLSLSWLCFVGYIGWAMRQPPEVFGHVMSRMPMPAYFLFPFETMWTRARNGTLHVGGHCTGSDGADARYSAAEAPIRALEGEASRSRLRQLYLTAFPAGGSRPEQAFGAVQGKGRFLRGLYP